MSGRPGQFRQEPMLALYKQAWQASRGSDGGFDAMNVPF